MAEAVTTPPVAPAPAEKPAPAVKVLPKLEPTGGRVV
jgi:hypothetical protein